MHRKAKKASWMSYTVQEFADAIPDVKTTTFEPLLEGLKRIPTAQIPHDVDIDSPYALFSLLWPEELWNTLATNTNKYARLQGAIPRGHDVK